MANLWVPIFLMHRLAREPSHPIKHNSAIANTSACWNETISSTGHSPWSGNPSNSTLGGRPPVVSALGPVWEQPGQETTVSTPISSETWLSTTTTSGEAASSGRALTSGIWDLTGSATAPQATEQCSCVITVTKTVWPGRIPIPAPEVSFAHPEPPKHTTIPYVTSSPTTVTQSTASSASDTSSSTTPDASVTTPVSFSISQSSETTTSSEDSSSTAQPPSPTTDEGSGATRPTEDGDSSTITTTSQWYPDQSMQVSKPTTSTTATWTISVIPLGDRRRRT
ncbi:hypothetical protein F4677DRAFT_448274 [Hypoxylon crocopeplum]|nr:hypothetical protein F4677DRAFT_448274 [Hypoxylon crocopeplum]